MSYVSIVLFLIGSTWWVELGGLDKGQLQYFQTSLNQTDVQLKTMEYLGAHGLRFKVDIPGSNRAPPLVAVTPFLNALSSMGFSLLSHNDEHRANKDMVYLTWMLQRETEMEPVNTSPMPFVEQ